MRHNDTVRVACCAVLFAVLQPINPAFGECLTPTWDLEFDGVDCSSSGDGLCECETAKDFWSMCHTIEALSNGNFAVTCVGDRSFLLVPDD